MPIRELELDAHWQNQAKPKPKAGRTENKKGPLFRVFVQFPTPTFGALKFTQETEDLVHVQLIRCSNRSKVHRRTFLYWKRSGAKEKPYKRAIQLVRLRLEHSFPERQKKGKQRKRPHNHLSRLVLVSHALITTERIKYLLENSRSLLARSSKETEPEWLPLQSAQRFYKTLTHPRCPWE